jgi:CheY-like chemotaxis protein
LTQGTTQISQSRNAMKRPKKILSVDDDPLNRDILTEYLTDGGTKLSKQMTGIQRSSCSTMWKASTPSFSTA